MRKVITAATIVVLLVVSLILSVRAGPPGQGPPSRPPGPMDETPRGHIAPAEVEAQATISEDFEGGTMPPTGWTHIQTNPNETWEIETLYPHDGSKYCANVPWDDALLDQDEVLLSPSFTPYCGSVELWSKGNPKYCRDTYDNCDLEVWFVNGSWGGSDDVCLGLVDDDWIAKFIWSYSTFDFSAYASGNPARIALRYVGKDGADIGVDDILIDYTGTSCGDDVFLGAAFLSLARRSSSTATTGTSCGDEVFLPIILRNY